MLKSVSPLAGSSNFKESFQNDILRINLQG
jgi:hypothetical protein